MKPASRRVTADPPNILTPSRTSDERKQRPGRAIPEATPIKHSGGSVFDTLEGNVLERTVPGQ